MGKARRQSFDALSSDERAVVGDEDDYDWDHALERAPRVRPETVQFSLRVERDLLAQLQRLARQNDKTVSDVAREAMDRYVQAGGRPGVSNLHVSLGPNARFMVQGATARPQFGASPGDDERGVIGVPPQPVTS